MSHTLVYDDTNPGRAHRHLQIILMSYRVETCIILHLHPAEVMI